jgi:hypothetical protein
MFYAIYMIVIVVLLVLVVLEQKRWKCICPGCNGTGLCADEGCLCPHSCCGDCERERVPWEFVPINFDNGRYRDIAPNGPLIGMGWIYGSFWRRLLLGSWLSSPIRKQREQRMKTLLNLQRLGRHSDIARWHAQVIETPSKVTKVKACGMGAVSTKERITRDALVSVVGAWWDEHRFAPTPVDRPGIHNLITRLYALVNNDE